MGAGKNAGRPEPTRAEVDRWKRLAREAKAAAADPRAPMGDLSRAAGFARKSVVPMGELTKANPFVRLYKLAHRYSCETPAGRRALAEDLGGLAGECEQLLTPREPGSRLPYRED